MSVGITTAIRYSLTRRAFSITPNGPEVLLLDYPSHQRRLLPLVAKTYAMSFAAISLKMMYVKRTPEGNKTLHVVSSAFKATLSWHSMQTLQECREACGGQGLKTENRIGQMKSDYDVNSTFEGDNNVIMQQVSKALLSVYVACKRKGIPLEGLGLEHMNGRSPLIPSKLSSNVLRSIHFQNDIFCLREGELLIRFATEVSQHEARGESKENALLMSYQIAADLGKAFADLAIYRAFLEAEASVGPGPLKVLTNIMEHEGGNDNYRLPHMGKGTLSRAETLPNCLNIDLELFEKIATLLGQHNGTTNEDMVEFNTEEGEKYLSSLRAELNPSL